MSTPLEIAQERGVSEIMHFTTDLGLLGIMAVGALLPRKELGEEELLHHILKVNAKRRWDHPWLGHVNLSVSRINLEFFRRSFSWHSGDLGRWWAILAFEPDVINDEGVYFSTTNNGYPSTLREKGEVGFKKLFASSISGKYGRVTNRTDSMPSHHTTDIQAEVLYPGRLSLEKLKAVYFEEEDHVHYFKSLCDRYGRSEFSDCGRVDLAKFGKLND